MVRSVRNIFAPINQIPPEILSLIPDHWCNCSMNEGLITLTHVCHAWRELFISRSSLWTYLDCTDVERTRVYIERSKTSPLEIDLETSDDGAYCDGALLLVAPHIDRLGSLAVCGPSDILADLTKHFACPTPLLKNLKIDLDFDRTRAPNLPGSLFNGDLSSLRRLSLSGFKTNLPWRNLVNLTTFNLSHFPGTVDPPYTTKLLDFFESTPLLRAITLRHSIPATSNAPPERLVSLTHLKELTTISQRAQSTLLNHLSIPSGALLDITFTFNGESPPILDNLPKNLTNLNNLSHVTTINLTFDTEEKSLRLSGPNGGLYISGAWAAGNSYSRSLERRVLRSLDRFNLSQVQRLTITKFTSLPLNNQLEESSTFRTLLLMNDLRTLTLIKCNNLPFIHALNPEKNKSDTVLCPDLQSLVLYVKKRDWFYLEELVEMASERDERYAKLSSVTIVSLDEMCSRKDVFKLRKFVTSVEYKLDVVSPEWDRVPGDEDDG